jgi:predicted Zn-dependent peptidase
MMKLLYGDQPAARSILGTPESVSSFTQKDFRKYHSTFYHPNNSLIVVVGPQKHGSLLTQIKKQFAHAPSVPVPKKKKVNDSQSVPAFSYRERKVDQMHIVAGFRSVPFGHKDAMTAEVLASVLGKGMSSRLFSKVREELGGAYYVRASQDGFSDHGIFSVSAGIDTNRAPHILSEIGHVLAEMKKSEVSSSELAKAKEIIKSGILMGFESTDAIASYYANFAILGQPLKSPKQLIREIDKVTSADVLRLAKKLFVPHKGVLAIVGPKKDDSLKGTFFDCLRSGGMVG